MKKRYFLICGLIVAGMLAASLVAYPHLPERAPTHWDQNGKVTGYGPRASLVLGMPAVMVFTLLLFAVLPSLSPRHFEIDRFRSAYLQIMLIFVATFAYLHALLLWAALSGSVPIVRALPSGMCVLWALLGNMLGKVKRNFFVGVRTPWTLANERVWYATHRFAAKTFVASGLLGLVMVFLFRQYATGTVVLMVVVVLLTGALAPVVYSLVYYKRLERQGALQS
jgi:uncharacterized membrane protein